MDHSIGIAFDLNSGTCFAILIITVISIISSSLRANPRFDRGVLVGFLIGLLLSVISAVHFGLTRNRETFIDDVLEQIIPSFALVILISLVIFMWRMKQVFTLSFRVLFLIGTNLLFMAWIGVSMFYSEWLNSLKVTADQTYQYVVLLRWQTVVVMITCLLVFAAWAKFRRRLEVIAVENAGDVLKPSSGVTEVTTQI